MATVVRAPGDLVIATTDGIDVRLAGVQVARAPLFVDVPRGTPCIIVYLSAVRGYGTVRHDELAWAAGQGPVDAGDSMAPTDASPPKRSNLTRVGVAVTDDAGGTYRPLGFRMVGDGVGWDDMRILGPAPSSTASALYLDFTVDGRSTGRSCEIALTA